MSIVWTFISQFSAQQLRMTPLTPTFQVFHWAGQSRTLLPLILYLVPVLYSLVKIVARKLWPEDVGGISLLEPSGSLWTSASVISLWLEALTSLCNYVKYVQHACINATKMCLQVLTWQLSLFPVPILSFCTLQVLSNWGWQQCSIIMRIHWISIEQYLTWYDMIPSFT